MSWDLLLLFKYITTHGRLTTNLLWVVDDMLDDILSIRVRQDLKNLGATYTDEMYDRLVIDVYVRLYHKHYKSNLEMFVLLMLLTLRKRHDDRDLYSFICESYIIRLGTLYIPNNQHSVVELVKDATFAYKFFECIAKQIEGYEVPISKWNLIANAPLKKCAFIIIENIYKRNKKDLDKYNGLII